MKPDKQCPFCKKWMKAEDYNCPHCGKEYQAPIIGLFPENPKHDLDEDRLDDDGG
jgi:predicted amidophosphoribosyltransferase